MCLPFAFPPARNWKDVKHIVSLSFFALLSLSSCGDLPKDPDSTLDRIRTERAYRVGLVASPGKTEPDFKSQLLLAAIGDELHASPQFLRGETEGLLTALEEGHIDLVIGQFEKKSPWSTRVTFGPALSSRLQGKSELLLRPVMKNGENGWIALVERHARDVASN